MKYFLPFGLLTWYFVYWWFTLLTVERSHLTFSDRNRDHWKQLRCILNIQRLTAEDSIFWFDLCGCIIAEDHALKMVFTRKKQDRILILNIIQEISTKSIYVNYKLPVGKSSHRNRTNYSFKKLFKMLRFWRVKCFVIVFFVWMSLQQRMVFKKSLVKWLFDITLTKINIHRLLMIFAW